MRLEPVTIKLLGADKVMWAYDYPHSDSPVDPVDQPEEDIVRVARGRPEEGGRAERHRDLRAGVVGC